MNYCTRCGYSSETSSTHICPTATIQSLPEIRNPRAEELLLINEKLDRLMNLLERLCRYEGYTP